MDQGTDVRFAELNQEDGFEAREPTLFEQVLAGWQLDDAFIKGALKDAATLDLVTLDVFDTALTRSVDSPIDAFAEMERRLCERLGPVAGGYAAERESAERDARVTAHEMHGAEEVDLSAILDALKARMPALAPHLDELKQVEFDVERDVLLAVPDILELTRRLNQAGIPYAFVSDMYLPSHFLAEVLARAGYAGWREIYVSCETGATKASGRQWAVLQKQYPDLGRILHLGDDRHADIETPARRGVHTLHYTRARSERRAGAALTPAILPFSRQSRYTALSQRAVPGEQLTDAQRWKDLGRVLGGVVLGGFLRWLEARVTQHGVDRLYFCARDGDLMMRAWQAAGLDKKTGVAGQYLYVARRPLNLACGYLDSKTGGRLSPALLAFLTSSYYQELSVDFVLTRAGLGAPDTAVHRALTARLGDLRQATLNDQTRQIVEELLQTHAPFVREALEQDYSALMGYLAQEGLTAEGRHAMVDMGWHGTMQRSLHRLLRSQEAEGELMGFYFGLWPQALRNLAGIRMESAFASPFEARTDNAGLAEGVAMLEELHTAAHGTVLGYRQSLGTWSPVLADSPLELRQFKQMTQHFQQGALETVAEIFGGASGACKTVFGIGELNRAAVNAAFDALFLSPNEDELRLLCGLGHCATYDHVTMAPIVDVRQGSLHEALRRSEWPMGALRQCLALATTEEERAAVRQVTAERYQARPRAQRPFQ